MKIIRRNAPDYQEQIKTFKSSRKSFNRELEDRIFPIIEAVKNEGDEALVRFALQFDHAEMTKQQMEIPSAEVAAAKSAVNPELLTAMSKAIENVKSFTQQRIPQDWTYNPRPGVTLGEKFTPLDSVGCYVPGGTAPLVSTAVHTVEMASASGVKHIYVTTPPSKDRYVNPALIHAAHTCGAERIFRLGGVYGVAALAFGTETVPKVDKIVGPGNAYVAAAKRLLYGQVAIDMVAGPSEIMIIADKTANPAFVAADLLSQAEHGSGLEQAVLVTTDDALIDKVAEQIEIQRAKLSRSECVAKVLQNGVYLVGASDICEAYSLCSDYAPEHVEVQTENPEEVAKGIRAAGAIFLGSWTPEPVGDYVAGPSHVLPTSGTAHFFNGLSTDTFFRRSSIIKYDKDALLRELPYIRTLALSEGLDAHANSAAIRGSQE